MFLFLCLFLQICSVRDKLLIRGTGFWSRGTEFLSQGMNIPSRGTGYRIINFPVGGTVSDTIL